MPETFERFFSVLPSLFPDLIQCDSREEVLFLVATRMNLSKTEAEKLTTINLDFFYPPGPGFHPGPWR